jgi:3-oxoacyl-[acyl-carrier-protein] synthase-3
MAHVSEELGDEPRHPAVVTVDHYGNTASTTHTVALIEELEAGHVRAGDRVALVALASGLVIGIVLFTVHEGLVKTYGHND